jgi:plastocyanin
VVGVGGGWTTPTTLVVTPGTEIRFKNTDPFPHRLFGVGGKTALNAGDTKAGGERIWTVPEAGVYEIRDELVPSLRMWIVAEEKAAKTAFPEPSGAFTLTVDAAGEYSVQVFFAGKPIGNALPATIAGPNAVLDLSGTPIVVAKAAPKSEAENQKGVSE